MSVVPLTLVLPATPVCRCVPVLGCHVAVETVVSKAGKSRGCSGAPPYSCGYSSWHGVFQTEESAPWKGVNSLSSGIRSDLEKTFRMSVSLNCCQLHRWLSVFLFPSQGAKEGRAAKLVSSSTALLLRIGDFWTHRKRDS